MCKNNNCSCNGKCSTNERVKDFSVREEVRVILEKNLEKDLGLTVDEIMETVEDDPLMMDAIALCIYDAIKEKLRERNELNESVNYKIDNYTKCINSILAERYLF